MDGTWTALILMSEDCPVYDRDARVCLVHPGDCEFRPASAEATLMPESPEVLTPDTPVDAMAGDPLDGVDEHGGVVPLT